jgi:hypothetical protein
VYIYDLPKLIYIPVICQYPVIARFATDNNTPLLHSCLSHQAYVIFHSNSDIIIDNELVDGPTCIEGCEQASSPLSAHVRATDEAIMVIYILLL